MDKRARQLLTTYARQGLATTEMEELKQLIEVKAPFLSALLQHLEDISGKQLCCPSNWKRFLESISSASPVCALIPPTDVALELLEELCVRDITSNPDVRKAESVGVKQFTAYVINPLFRC